MAIIEWQCACVRYCTCLPFSVSCDPWRHQYGKKGYMKRACKGKPRSGQRRPDKKQKQVKKVEDDKEEESDSDDLTIKHLSLKGVDMKVDNCPITMEVDTGASLSLMSYNTFGGVWPGRSLESTDVRLPTYSKEPIPVLGCTYLVVRV